MQNIFVFSSQGLQHYFLGKNLMNNNECFNIKITALDNIVKDIYGFSVIENMYQALDLENKKAPELKFNFLGKFMVEHALCHTLVNDYEIYPDLITGASLGEITALVNTGALTEQDAIRILTEYAGIIQAQLIANESGMIAISDTTDIFHQNFQLRENAELVSINSDRHFTISCKRSKIPVIKYFLASKNVLHIELPVAYGYHSSQLEALKIPFHYVMKDIEYKRIRIPFISGSRGEEINKIDNNFIWNLIREPIQFLKTINAIESIKTSNYYLDMGASGILSSFIKQILPEGNITQSKVPSIVSPFGINKNILPVLAKDKSSSLTIKNELNGHNPWKKSLKIVKHKGLS